MCHYGFGVDVSKVRALQHLKQQELDTATRLFCESLDNRLQDEFKLPRRADGLIAIGKNAKRSSILDLMHNVSDVSIRSALLYQLTQELENKRCLRLH